MTRPSILVSIVVLAIAAGALTGAPRAGAAPAVALTITAPASVSPAAPFEASVTAVDADGLPDTAFGFTVHFSSSDSLALLPADNTLLAGVRFYSVALQTLGVQTLTVSVTDPNSGIPPSFTSVT